MNNNNDLAQTLQHLIGSRYVPSLKAYISELTGVPDVAGPGETDTKGRPDLNADGRPDGVPGEIDGKGRPGIDVSRITVAVDAAGRVIRFDFV